MATRVNSAVIAILALTSSFVSWSANAQTSGSSSRGRHGPGAHDSSGAGARTAPTDPSLPSQCTQGALPYIHSANKLQHSNALKLAWSSEYGTLCKSADEADNDNLAEFVGRYFVKQAPVNQTPKEICAAEGKNAAMFEVVPAIAKACGVECAETGVESGSDAGHSFCGLYRGAKSAFPSICTYFQVETCETAFDNFVSASCPEKLAQNPQGAKETKETACSEKNLPAPPTGWIPNPPQMQCWYSSSNTSYTTGSACSTNTDCRDLYGMTKTCKIMYGRCGYFNNLASFDSPQACNSDEDCYEIANFKRSCN